MAARKIGMEALTEDTSTDDAAFGRVKGRKVAATNVLPMRSRTLNARTQQVCFGALAAIVWLVSWQLLTRHRNPLIYPTPVAVIQAIPDVVQDGLFGAYWTTMSVFIVSFTVSSVVGILVGLIMGLSQPARYFFQPVVIALYSTPGIVLIPLFIVWLGLGFWPKFALVFLAAALPVTINTEVGVQSVGREFRELARAYGATRIETVRKLILPAAVPFIFSGIRIAMPRSFVALIAAEMLITLHGMGGIAIRYGNAFQMAKFMIPTLLLVLTSLVVSFGLTAIQGRLSRWRTE